MLCKILHQQSWFRMTENIHNLQLIPRGLPRGMLLLRFILQFYGDVFLAENQEESIFVFEKEKILHPLQE